MARAIMIFILAFVSTIAVAGERNYKVKYRFNFESDGGIYAFELRNVSEPTQAQVHKEIHKGIVRPSIANIKIANRKIYIECLDKCTCKNSYQEELGRGSGWPAGSGLLGVFLVEDGSRHLVTTWITNTSYNVILYGCESGHMGRVLAINSRTLPAIYADNNGMPVVKYSPDYDHPDSTATLHWNGHSYSAE